MGVDVDVGGAGTQARADRVVMQKGGQGTVMVAVQAVRLGRKIGLSQMEGRDRCHAGDDTAGRLRRA